ncbi:MAG: UDP-3-O-(3-hydroxymyristoyl)glucosamine N-acyltransferase, partial [Alphaproteobacteria bacterium]
DNLVQIAQNVHVGKGSVLVAQVGIAGSTHVGDFSVFGGQVGLSGHLKIAPGTQIAAKSGVVRDTTPGEILAGIPAVPIQEWRRQSVKLRRLGKKDSEI